VTWRKDGYVPQGVPHVDARHEQSIDKHGQWLIPRVEDPEHRYNHGDTARIDATAASVIAEAEGSSDNHDDSNTADAGVG
jgi:hypothetical protein